MFTELNDKYIPVM